MSFINGGNEGIFLFVMFQSSLFISVNVKIDA